MYGRKTYFGIAVALLVLATSAARASDERFVSAGRAAGTLEMRAEATVFGPEVRLKQVCRWGEGDAKVFGDVGDLVVTRVADGGATIQLAELRELLRDAGVNLARVRFAGPVNCVVTRADGGEKVSDLPRAVPATAPTTRAAEAEALEGPVVSLKERLTRDLADRLQLPIDSLQISFNAGDEKFLNLTEPQFQFTIEPRRVRNLGTVSWEVTAGAGGATAGKPVVVTATARAWQNQLVANRPISGRQIIRPEDVIEKRALVETLPDGPLATREQVVGQLASLDLKPGTVLNGRMVQALPLARVGQLVTVTVQMGAVQIRTVAKAMDEGTYGQTIRVRNEGTKEIYQVTLTGPQAGVVGVGSNG